MKWEGKAVDNIDWDGIDHKDYPDYCDAHIVSCDIDGVPATEEQLEEINDDPENFYEALMDHIF